MTVHIVFIVCALLITFAAVYSILKAAGVKFVKDCPCDSCEYLTFKRNYSSNMYRFSCDRRGKFDTPPVYCKSYTQRKDGEDE